MFKIRIDNIILFKRVLTQRFRHKLVEKRHIFHRLFLFEQNSFKNIGHNPSVKRIKVL